MIPIETTNPQLVRVTSSKIFSYTDRKGEEVELHIRLFTCGDDPKLFLVMDFFKRGVLINIPDGIYVLATTEDGTYPLVYPHPGAHQFSFGLGFDFDIRYKGDTLVRGLANIKLAEEITDFHVRSIISE